MKGITICLSFFFLLKVMEAEQTKTRSELVHKETAAKYNAAMGRMKQLEKKLKRAINKSKYVSQLVVPLNAEPACTVCSLCITYRILCQY